MCVVTAGEQTNTDWSRICQGKTLVGRIHAILERVENTAGDTIHAVSIDAYTLVNSRHPHFGMPELRGTDERPPSCRLTIGTSPLKCVSGAGIS